MISQVRQNYSFEAEAFVNHLVNLYLQAFYTYISMGYYFRSKRGIMEPLGPFFRLLAREKHECADKLLNMQTVRGGRAVFHRIENPPKDAWGTALEGMEVALAVEKDLNQALLDLITLGRTKKDPHLCCFLRPFLEEGMKLIQKIEDQLTILRRGGTPQDALSDDLEKLTFNETGNPPCSRGF